MPVGPGVGPKVATNSHTSLTYHQVKSHTLLSSKPYLQGRRQQSASSHAKPAGFISVRPLQLSAFDLDTVQHMRELSILVSCCHKSSILDLCDILFVGCWVPDNPNHTMSSKDTNINRKPNNGQFWPRNRINPGSRRSKI